MPHAGYIHSVQIAHLADFALYLGFESMQIQQADRKKSIKDKVEREQN